MKEIRFTKRDVVIVLILGELVGLFGYAILRGLAQTEDAAAIIRGLVAHPLTFPIFVVGVPLAALAALIIAFLLGKRINPSFFQFGKFAATGFSNTAIDWGVLNLLLTPLGFATGTYAIGKAISFSVATLNSFVWNKFWSFEKKSTKHIGKEALGFAIVTGIGLVVNVAVATGVKIIGPDIDIWPRIVAPAIGTATTLFWNFFGYKLIVFKDKHDAIASSNKLDTSEGQL